MRNAIAEYISFYTKSSPITVVYGLARTLLALGTFITFSFNSTDDLFINLAETINSDNVSTSSIVRAINIFTLLGAKNLLIAKILVLLILSLVIIGWRPRFTGILHWWVSFSFSSISPTIDGGDTIASIITFFFIPICLSDNRKFHWSAHTDNYNSPYLNLFLWSLVFIIRLQVCIIYLHSGIDKLRIEEWQNGTCTYYWFTNNIYGAAAWLKPLVEFLMAKPIIVVAITWGTIIFEIVLGMSIFMDRKKINWRILLSIGILFHLGIVLVFGLISFFMSMLSCLVLYLIPFARFQTFQELSRICTFKLSLKRSRSNNET